ncbi:FixH family protein [Gillisia sp. M10.2A]|uniref:FixH family protein n=1 Tax=Gillisia lutea TaxID=2909668 RepID=A0ABS9EIV3_9FLAO|nr:FixH family protein [Gillisia lutea]MCF4101403.1 FixH family protein [Gillisia lutea]
MFNKNYLRMQAKKMKINWGYALVLVMISFMGFILFFVVKISTDKNLDHDLVTEEYYKKEMKLQDDIDAQQNTANMAVQIKGQSSELGYILIFPKSMENVAIKGEITLYRPSNKKLDFSLPLVLTNSQIVIPNEQLLEGRWNITVDWEYQGKKYRYQESIVY